MDSYHVTIQSKAPILMHQDNIDFSDELKEWRNSPDNKKTSVAGDDRSPAHTWLGCLYTGLAKTDCGLNGAGDDKVVMIPSDNLMRCIMEGGAMVPTGGKNGKTFKAQTQSGMMLNELGWALLINGKPIKTANLEKLVAEREFKKHIAVVRQHGFDLFTKRARIGTQKHVRVRPKFSNWSLSGILNVHDEQITQDVVASILNAAGEYKGLCDWRPSSRTPGPYGRFTATIEAV